MRYESRDEEIVETCEDCGELPAYWVGFLDEAGAFYLCKECLHIMRRVITTAIICLEDV